MAIISNFPEDKIHLANGILNIYEQGDFFNDFHYLIKSIRPDSGNDVYNNIMDFIADVILGNGYRISINDIRTIADQLSFIIETSSVWNVEWKTLEDYLEWCYKGTSIDEIEEDEISNAKNAFESFAESLDELDYAKSLFRTEGYTFQVLQMVIERARQNGHIIIEEGGFIFSLGKLNEFDSDY